MAERTLTMLGRKMLFTDFEEVTKDNIIQIVSKAYADHQKNVAEELFLFEYEKGNQPILGREKKIRSDINTKIVENRASEIVDVHVGYCFSNPITYVQRAKIESGKNETDARKEDLKVSMLNKMAQEQSKGSKDIELARNMFICGLGYQMVLPTKNKKRYSPFDLLVPNPLTTFVVYSNDAYRRRMLGCTYFTHDDGTISLTAYSDKWCFNLKRTIDGVTELWKIVQNSYKQEITPNILGMVPIVEFAMNDRMGIFEKVIPMLDEINTIDSDRINDIAQHVQSLLWMHNCAIDGEGKKNLVDGDGVIMTKSNGDGKEAKIVYLSQTLDQTQIQSLVDHLNDKIDSITSTPSRKEASGGSTTGAMQLSNGWQMLELSAKAIEQVWTEPEMEILDLATEIINNDPRPIYEDVKGLETADIEPRFCRNKIHDLVSKVNALVTLLNAGVDGLTAFNTIELFPDTQQAWCDSAEIINAIQKKLASAETSVATPNPNAYKDEEGNGGENNEPKEKIEESVQPSKVAGVTE